MVALSTLLCFGLSDDMRFFLLSLFKNISGKYTILRCYLSNYGKLVHLALLGFCPGNPVERLVRDAVLPEKEAQLGRMFLHVAHGA